MCWDIFCRVIDNLGDIGTCWRLARQLSSEHGISVRLWVDDLSSLQPLYPEVDKLADEQCCAGVEIRHWTVSFPDTVPAEVVIEAFGCEVPESYQSAMAQTTTKPLWINLEYLSAESWVEGCHLLPSPQPKLALTKVFFFPGFTPKTGGLLREADLLTRRDALQRDPARIWQRLNLPCPGQDETTVSLFCYNSAPITELLNAWQNSNQPVRCLLPEGQLLTRVASHFGRTSLGPGDKLVQGKLSLLVLPFLRQEEYDLLLWACDINFVRGEDSFVRAQWAGKPLVWQIYVQDKNTHLVKLEAFLDRYCKGMEASDASIVRSFQHAWNEHKPLNWDDFAIQSTTLEAHARTWASDLAGQTDIASGLVNFCKNKL